jgi:hypothetical protein
MQYEVYTYVCREHPKQQPCQYPAALSIFSTPATNPAPSRYSRLMNYYSLTAPLRYSRLKGLCHEMNNFWKVLKIKLVLSVQYMRP